MQDIETLLSFLSNFRDFHDEKAFFRAVDTFVQESWSSSPVLVFSLPKNESDSWSIDQCRLVWNKSRLGDENLSRDRFSEIVNKSKETSPCEFDERLYYLFPLGVEGTQQVFMLVDVPKSSALVKLNVHFARFLKTGFDNMEKYKEVRRLQSLVHVDDVTGLYNQRKLHKDLDEAIERFNNEGEPFYVLFIDIDHFKKVNDGHGHLVGTRLLVEVAKLMRRTLRETDLVYRYGGDEYVLILPGADDTVARMVGRRMLAAIKDHTFTTGKGDDSEMHLSVSIGLAGFPKDAKSRDDILDIADRMMYQAKESGRGRVCHAGELFDS